MWNDPATQLKGKGIEEYQYFRVKPQEKIFTQTPEIPGYPGITFKYVPCCSKYSDNDKEEAKKTI